MCWQITAQVALLAAALSANPEFPQAKPAAIKGFVFVSLAEPSNLDIFHLKDGETTPVNLTGSPGADVDPAISKDGRKIAFVSGRRT